MNEIVRQARHADDPFFVVDLGSVQDRIDLWRSQLPDVEPFYAVKCNPDDALLSCLASAGLGFDCASRGEIQKVFELGVPSSRIIYANPCKQPSHMRFAADHGVHLATFDSEAELEKSAAHNPQGSLLLRIGVDDSMAQCVLSDKYGASMSDVPFLLRRARELNLNVRGVAFHVGSGNPNPDAFTDALSAAAHVHDLSAREGHVMDTTDIGGGFPGVDTPDVSFEAIAAKIRPALAKYFPSSRGVRVIAEPGRFLAASSHTLAVSVIGKKVKPSADANGEDHTMYYVNDGVYGSFNCLLYDHAEVEAHVLPTPSAKGPSAETHAQTHSSSVWGPTCDGIDCVAAEVPLPTLDVGQWLYFRNMGAYTAAAGSTFNGMELPGKVYL